ncbi:OB-fold domain-containing protein [Sphingomonas sp. ID0503]|uniref:OB-fold domain-containing protein n=1 Tax=Sphingomonas sp. ID0503 TaxID=3399691 RepID=UPI003AFB6A54
MTDRFISAVGGYLPLLRFERAAASKALRYAGLGGRGGGYRALAGWDEDPVTMAVEAGRQIVGAPFDRLVFASTSAPFYERSHATLAVEALGLAPTTRTSDLAGTRRCAVSGLLDALLGGGDTVVIAGEKRPAKPGSAAHSSFGDGGGAVRVGDTGAARLIGHASLSHDLVDLYASRESPLPYAYEERFVRETAVSAVLAPTIRAACAAAGIDGGRIAHAAVHEPLSGTWKDLARAVGTAAPNHAADLESRAGDLGAAHALFAAGLAFSAAKPGDIVLVAGFGSGCDALLFEVTGKVAGSADVAEMLRGGLVTQDYTRFLSLTGAIDLDWGMRAEFEQKAQGTVLERHGRDAMGFVGGRDAAGNVQFPKSRVPVRPDASGPEAMEDVRLADLTATLKSVTADRLNYTPDPPFWFGLVQFDNGARVLMELTDAGAEGFRVGDQLRMRFRIKSHDRRRGFRTYFWKAAPAARPVLEN